MIYLIVTNIAVRHIPARFLLHSFLQFLRFGAGNVFFRSDCGRKI